LSARRAFSIAPEGPPGRADSNRPAPARGQRAGLARASSATGDRGSGALPAARCAARALPAATVRRSRAAPGRARRRALSACPFSRPAPRGRRPARREPRSRWRSFPPGEAPGMRAAAPPARPRPRRARHEAVVCDKGYAGAEFALAVEAIDGAKVLRLARANEPDNALHLSSIRQRIESVFWTCRDPLTLEAPRRPHDRQPQSPPRQTTARTRRRHHAQPPARPPQPLARRLRSMSAWNQPSSHRARGSGPHPGHASYSGRCLPSPASPPP
jgi:hypothetical protein